MMRKVSAALLICAGVGIACFGLWIDVPSNIHTTLFLNERELDYDGVAVFAECSKEMFGALFRGTEATSELLDTHWMLIDLTCAQKWGEAYRALYVEVRPREGYAGRASWYPWEVVIVQGNRMYRAITEDILVGLSDVFSGRIYVRMDGFIRVPEWLDYSRPFTIWYFDDSASIGPIAH